MTRSEWLESAERGQVPAIRNDGDWIQALGVVRGERPLCSDWTLDQYVKIGIGTYDEIAEVKAAIDSGKILCVPDDVTDGCCAYQADYFAPENVWRYEAIKAACQIQDEYRHIVIGLLYGYSDDDINAYILRNWYNTRFEKIQDAWAKAYNWILGRNYAGQENT